MSMSFPYMSLTSVLSACFRKTKLKSKHFIYNLNLVSDTLHRFEKYTRCIHRQNFSTNNEIQYFDQILSIKILFVIHMI